MFCNSGFKLKPLEPHIMSGVCSLCRCTVEVNEPAGERLTGAGPRSQRGLESPGAEVGRCSLKDEGDRQGDKHGPLSTWGSLCFYFSLTFSSLIRRPSVVLWPFFVCSSRCVEELGWFGGKRHSRFVFSDVDPNCACSDLHLLVSKFV